MIRPAVPADARAIGALHVHSWQTAYRGLLPDELLDNLDLETRIRSWERILSPGGSRSTTFVAEVNGQVAAFCSVGQSRDDGARQTTGEVWALYVAPEHVRHGIGSQMFRYGLDLLRAGGATESTLWVLEGNVPARAFYEKQGWAWDGARKLDQRGAYVFPELRYRALLLHTDAPEEAGLT